MNQNLTEWLEFQNISYKEYPEFVECLEFFMERISTRKLYHYTSLNAFRQIWETGRLKITAFKEPKILIRNILERNITLDVPIEVLMHYFRLKCQYGFVSFVNGWEASLHNLLAISLMGYLSPNEKKVCIEFDADKIPMQNTIMEGQVIYSPQTEEEVISCLSNISTLGQLQEEFWKNSKKFFLYKHECWAMEDEYRKIMRTNDDIEIANALTAVYAVDNNRLMTDIRSIVDGYVDTQEICKGSIPEKFKYQKDFPAYFIDSANKMLVIKRAEKNYSLHKDELNFKYIK